MLDRITPPTYHQITNIKLTEVEQRHLKNGVPLHIINVGKQEVLRLDFIIHAGTINEQKTGLAFFTTKMLAEGTTKFTAKEIAQTLDTYGAHLELSPGLDYCYISVYCLSKHLASILPVIHSLITEATFPEKELEIQKNIKKQKLKVDNNKNAVVASKNFRKALFGDTGYGNLLEEDDIINISASSLQNFYQHNFINNYEIIISGYVLNDSLDLLEKYFGTIPFSKGKRSDTSLPEPKPKIGRINYPKDSLQSSIRSGRILFPLTHPDYHKMLVLNTIFGGYFGSRLMKNIREEKGYTYGIYSSLVPLKLAGYFLIGADVVGEHTDDTLLEIDYEIQKLKDVPIDSIELETAKNYMLGSFLSGLNSPFAIADKYRSVYLNGLSMNYYNKYIDTINKVDSNELLALANKYLNTSVFTTVVVGKV